MLQDLFSLNLLSRPQATTIIIMKFSAFLALLAVASTQAFAPSNMPKARSNTQLYSRTDSSDLIQQALAASKKYGASSPEARLAWEAVEEVDSADNR